MYCATKRKQVYLKDEKNSQYGIYSGIKECTFEEFIDLAPEAENINRKAKYYEFFITGDTETSRAYYSFKDIQLLCPYNTPIIIKDKQLKDYPRVDYVYFWQIDFNGLIGFGRDIREFVEFINYINKVFKKKFKTNSKTGKKFFYKKIKFFFHNLGYDYQFFKEYFPNANIAIGTDVSPVVVDLCESIQLIDSMRLTDASLKNSLSWYNINIPKDGLNHEVIRTPETKLTDREIGYCLDDVYYLRKLIESKLEYDKEYYKDIRDLPYTKTMEVSYFMREILGKKDAYISLEEAKEIKNKRLIDESKNYKKISDIKYLPKYEKKTVYYKHHLIEFKDKQPRILKMYEVAKMILTKRCGHSTNNKDLCREELEQLRKTYCGGFTHANMKYLGSYINETVACYDLTSDYTSEMSTQKYVYSYSIKTNKIENDTDIYGYVFKAKIKNIKSKHSYGLISVTKKDWKFKGLKRDKIETVYNTITVDNGRLIQCEEVELYGTDIDLENWKKVYTWDSIEFSDIKKGRKYYLHGLITDSIDHFYTLKSKYKGLVKKAEEEGKTEEEIFFSTLLKLAKAKLNSMYGLSVMDKLKYVLQNIEVDDFNSYEEYEKFCEETIDNYYGETCKYEKSLFTYAIGMQVTCYARKRIIDVITQIPDDIFLYADTDSIYFIKDDKVINMILKYNEGMQKEIQSYIKRKHIEDQAKIWKENDKLPSQYAPEYPFSDGFLTLGAKRYIKVFKKDDKYKFKVTVAGCNKTLSTNLLNSFNNLTEGLNYFRMGLNMTPEQSGKKLHKYIDKKSFVQKYNIEDADKNSKFMKINIDGCEIEVSNWVSLYPIGFNMSYSNSVKTCVRELFGKEINLGYSFPKEVLDNFDYFDYVD